MSTQAILALHREEEGKLGPAMLALPTDGMRAFVYAMLDTGGQNQMLCAKESGYTGNERTLAVTGHRLAHDERVQAAIQEEARRRMNAGAILAVNTVLSIAANSAHKDQLRAATAILDRTGLNATTEHKVTVERSEDERAMIREIMEYGKKFNLDIKALLGAQGIDLAAIEGEFTEIAPPAKEDWEI